MEAEQTRNLEGDITGEPDRVSPTLGQAGSCAASDQDSRSDAHLAYSAAVQLWVFSGQVIWERFNSMLVVNSILLLASIYSLVGSAKLVVPAIALSSGGI